jgi:antitoxin component of RelBE/YafQ-DinJ toxin-antitoxin module
MQNAMQYKKVIMKSPAQLVVRVTPEQHVDLVAVAEQLGLTVSELIRAMVEEALPRYKEKAAAEGVKLKEGKRLREQVEEATTELVEDLRRGRLVLTPDQLSAPKALAVAELIQRLRPHGEDAGPMAAELRAGLLRALKAAPDASPPESPASPQRIRKYRKRRPD